MRAPRTFAQILDSCQFRREIFVPLDLLKLVSVSLGLVPDLLRCQLNIELVQPLDLLKLVSVSFRLVPDLFKYQLLRELFSPRDLLNLASVSFRRVPDVFSQVSLTSSCKCTPYHQSLIVSTTEFSRFQQKTDCMSFFLEYSQAPPFSPETQPSSCIILQACSQKAEQFAILSVLCAAGSQLQVHENSS